jgi:tetratricopeptide (TPR) repeat protein
MDGREELAPLLAHHYTMAIRPEDLDLAWAAQESEVARLRASAVTWSRRAAELAVGRYEMDDGIALLRRAVELEPDSTVQAELWYQIGHASALKYDGEAFVAAMERALELGAPKGDVYTELAYQTSMRAGMWQRQLASSLVEGWIEQAIVESGEGTSARVRALVARANWYDNLDAARAALAIADTIGDVQLRFEALGALQSAMQQNGEFLAASDVAASRLDLTPAIRDPDQVADALFMNADLFLTVGRLADARAMAERMAETVASLTPHHRVHGLGVRLILEMAVADWEAVRELTQATEHAIEANLATPCPFNVGLPLRLATAWTHAGDEATSARLVAKAESIGMVGYGRTQSPVRLQLAIARHDREGIRLIIDSVDREWLTSGAWELWTALFDGLVEIDDRDRIETDAPGWLGSDAYVAPFAMRALAIARKDKTLLADAVARFETMGLERHAEATRARLERLGTDIAGP